MAYENLLNECSDLGIKGKRSSFKKCRWTL